MSRLLFYHDMSIILTRGLEKQYTYSPRGHLVVIVHALLGAGLARTTATLKPFLGVH